MYVNDLAIQWARSSPFCLSTGRVDKSSRDGPWFNIKCQLASIGNPILAIRRIYDCLISTMGLPILVRHLYIESGPWSRNQTGANVVTEVHTEAANVTIVISSGSLHPGQFRMSEYITFSLRWPHHEHDGVSYHLPHDCLLNHLFRRRSKKISKLRITGICVGNSPVTNELPAQKASNAENVNIWLRHHVLCDNNS